MNFDLVGAVLSGVLGRRRKRSRNALRYLGRGGRGGVINANTLVTVAGLAWGAYEAWQAKQTAHATPAAAGGSTVPPVPGPVVASDPGSSDARTARLVRLAIAAANADGSLSDAERSAIGAQVKAAGATDAPEALLEAPGTLSEIVAGVIDVREKTTLYVLAFTIVRADEQVSGAERIFLAQLANLLGLDPMVIAGLEKSVGDGIDAEAQP